MRADEQKSHRRLSSGASQHKMTKPAVSRGRVNAAVVHGRLMFLFGEICLKSIRCFAMGAGLRPTPKGVETPPDPGASAGSACVSNCARERAEVSRGHSSRSGIAVKGRTGMDKEEP